MNHIDLQGQLAAQYQQERRRDGATERALRAARPRPLAGARRLWIVHFAPGRRAAMAKAG
jgi:hypothetical protein